MTTDYWSGLCGTTKGHKPAHRSGSKAARGWRGDSRRTWRILGACLVVAILVVDILLVAIRHRLDSGSVATRLSGTEWVTQSDFSRTGNHEQEWYEASAAKIEGSSIELTADTFAHVRSSPVVSKGIDYPFRSGDIESVDSFLYGTFEMRAQLPAGSGLWPAFWLVQTPGEPISEIDIMEEEGRLPSTIFNTFIWSYSPIRHTAEAANTGKNLTDGFHTYGLVWTPTSLRWTFDGKVTKSLMAAQAAAMGTSIPSRPLRLVADLAVGSGESVGGAPNTANVFPAVMKIEWISAQGL